MNQPLEAFNMREPRIAYFSMEIALRSEIPTYSGGLGVLAGDAMRSASDLDLPMVGVTLVSRAGYFRQEIVDGRQLERPDIWQPEQWAQRLGAKISVQVGARELWVAAWLYEIHGQRGASVPVLLLDTDLPENEPEDRELTHHLYGGDEAYRMKQEMVLGIGGVRMLGALGFSIRKYHLNEGHAALLALELLRRFARSPQEAGTPELQFDVPAVRERCVFTTHTPVEAGHDKFSYELADRLLGPFIGAKELRQLAGQGELNMTRLALNLSECVNGVTPRHAEVSRKMFPGYQVHAITNGVHPWTWACDSLRRLFDAFLPRWSHEPELLARADLIPDEELRRAHAVAKLALLHRIQGRDGLSINTSLPVLGFARRMTPYKRADLLFFDIDRLRAIAREHPFQIVLAGKAHPRDLGGKQIIERLHAWARELGGAVPVHFLPNYDMETARLLVSGVDVWLNTPLSPLEASGTSGMKAALNGVPNLSVLDGWWLEGCIEGVTGWAVGGETVADEADVHARDAASLYLKLDQKVLPLYHESAAGWTAVMKGAIARNGAYFSSHRMMKQYAVEAYLH
ncbi:alpha-glucan family phosphorylase [Variovorax soli]|uniref:glycogen phosphorylase n=1 Tax=Variovorax soli TaxID=376815 RepID=A0ABU1NFK2_9BURK|nr:alpha-glucan family phosphorylase [Variovorax soli]MDR6536790.1 starch phosphorylase [Variovorax soli]